MNTRSTEDQGLEYIDFHSHIIPKMDDGSPSVEVSLDMIQALRSQGVRRIVLTPHFYPSVDCPEHFLEKRSKQYDALASRLGESDVQLVCGAEVRYFDGITAMAKLHEMRMGSSEGLLIEMPFCKWTYRMVNDILEINSRKGYQVIIAHIERYFPYIKDTTLYHLVNNGILIQGNSSFFTGRFTSGKAIRMLRKGLIHLIGSDCHNMSSRPPEIRNALSVIEKKCGYEAVNSIMERGASLLDFKAWNEMSMSEETVL